MPNVIIAGSRSFNDYELAKRSLDYFLGQLKDVTIISGGAQGADAIGKRYAQEHGIPHKEYPADWKTHGKAAGPIRNKQMAEDADFCIMFWNGVSRGTANMLEMCKKYDIEYRVRFFQATTQWPFRIPQNKF